MQQLMGHLLAFLSVIISTLLIASRPGLAETIRLSVADWPPYYYKTNPADGEHAKIINQLFKQVGLEVEYVWYDDWKAAFNTAKAGRHHGTPSWRCNPERAKYFNFTLPIFNDPYVFFHLTDTPFHWNSYSQLKAWEPIGVTASYFYGEDFHQAVAQDRIYLHQVRIDVLMFRLLLRGRIQLALMTRDNGQSLMRRTLTQQQQAKITYHPTPVTYSISHILFSKQWPGYQKLVKSINQQIIQSKDLFPEEIQAIQQQWQGCK
ncbi:transporter substrate-binding domain-containing protein [Endozoicomonas sp. SM1973]|uniref:Transporter substrate-binding domain-containing protein n=1 Tax=Spartinivicinus marinus TaxID=2994442 RepID=A0A853HUF9_9GAMM|nr:transporter substrate-binding domain-containing protein [Spartinivicinus marinus]MCX4029854.1 transporter substrate-binding domain-containing protein [Spartinivicinus marinus]NYZ64903.1 transporter substrate-binding domain-containing protein [Spartinivicinus marinus]